MRVRISTHGKKNHAAAAIAPKSAASSTRLGRDCSKNVTITDKIDEEIRNNQDRDRSGLLRKRTLKTAERDREDPHPEQDEQLKEHQGLIWCSVRNFSSWSVSKFAST